MKKNLLLLSCLALLAACGGNGGSEYDKYYSGDKDTTETATATTPPAQAEPATSEAVAGNYEKGIKLISSSDCLACHQEKQKVVGPAYVDVAQKYDLNDKNVDYLAEKIIKGGSGVWGQVPMSPHPDIKEADAKEMARYILSLRK
ncbi:c-type cytochrome [Botryobacter ruber]|uniref:c-type cytochrome n=1 Tax=Botryobacter ruber TaxID=2171629 RepID=UPI000E0BF260|nr:c-type cytochrome [Botryobacter ruber]